MICSNCGTQNEAGRKFCKECGTSLAAGCPNCGATNSADAKFCGECGTQLTSAPPAAAVPTGSHPITAQPIAERRLVSVLFADLVGFTTLAESRDLEETRDLLSRYFDLARDVITRHGGTVEKFIGDAVMAVWGAPVAREDDAERAVRAGLALVDAVKGLGSEIQARAGVLTGEAAVTIGATAEGMVAGDLVNTASRLQSVATPGTVLVGEATERAANQGILFEPAGEQALKGKSAPVPAFRAVRIVAEVGGRNRSGGLEAPFVGRDDDLRLLKDLFHATEREKRPRLVSIFGPAGIGKSRMASEFSKYADGLVEDTYWHAGRSPSYGEGITFWALGEMVRRRAGLLETDDEATTREKLAESVAQWVPDPAEQNWIQSALLVLLGHGDANGAGRAELFGAWRTYFERIAEHGTTVLLFEDLQWADKGLIDFIDHLLDWTKSLPIFVITLARPELLERRVDWGYGRRNFVSLALEPLSAEHMDELLEGLVPGLASGVKLQIISRADGVPLYAVETVRMLMAEGRLHEKDGRYLPVGDLTRIAIPETLAALIAARLDSLDARERSVIQAAAVLGQSFTEAALEALSGIDADELSKILDGFGRRELFTVDIDPRSPERGQYSFMQALIREVAYNQLARPERKMRHLAAARWFESLGDDELAGVLAGHYASAYRNATEGPEADALASQAKIALRGAADRAANLGSHGQAATFLLQALEMAEIPAERASLLERIGGETHDDTPESALTYYDQAMDLYRSLGDLNGVARCATGIAVSLQILYRPADAVPILDAAVKETAAIAGQPDAVMLLAELARACANTRDPRALQLVDQVLELAEPLELMSIIAEGLINRALVLTYAGRYYEPTTLLRGVLPIAEAHGLTFARIRAMNNLAVGLMSDNVREAAGLFSEAVEVSRRAGTLGSLAFFRAGLVELNVALGEWDAVDETIVELAEVDPTESNFFEYFQWLAVYRALRGDASEAAVELAKSRAQLDQITLFGARVQQSWIESQVAAFEGELDKAYEHAATGIVTDFERAFRCAEWAVRVGLWTGDVERARTGLAGFEQVRWPGRVIKAHRTLAHATVEALEGRATDATAGFRNAIGLLRELDVPMYLGMGLVDCAIALGPDVPEGKAAAVEAREHWTRLNSPPMRARLDEGLARWQPMGRGTSESRLESVAEG